MNRTDLILAIVRELEQVREKWLLRLILDMIRMARH